LIVYILLFIGTPALAESREIVYSAFPPMFYLILVQLVCGDSRLPGVFTRFHGRIEDEEDFLRSLKKEVKP
jgi:hypothetical protein